MKPPPHKKMLLRLFRPIFGIVLNKVDFQALKSLFGLILVSFFTLSKGNRIIFTDFGQGDQMSW
jgi:hypothetical protein